MAMTGFFCQDKYLEQTKKMSDEELGRLFRACMIYHARGEEIELEGRESLAFDFIRQDIDDAEDAYNAKCEKNRQNRLNAIEYKKNERQRSITNDNECQEMISNVDKENKKKEKEKENKKEESKRFTPPTVEEVAEYCRERNNQVDPEKFHAFYASKGWKVGNQPMKDWKMCVITWEKRENKPVKAVPAAQYEQRSYLKTDAEARQRMIEMMRGEAG